MSDTRSAHSARRAIRPDDADRRRRAAQRLRRSGRMRSLTQRLRRRLGLPQVILVDGIRYTERGRVPLRRALSPRGEGVKEYVVRFPDGRGRMRIRCTAARIFDDLATDPRLAFYQHGLARLRPGMRVLEFGCGTGAGSARIARAVGPSGGIVALGADRESIRYARRRYRFDHTAFEFGGIETLRGELDGSFDAVFVHAADKVPPEHLAELWRCVAGEGWMLLTPPPVGPDGGLNADLPAVGAIHHPAHGVFILDRRRDPPRPARDRPSLDE